MRSRLSLVAAAVVLVGLVAVPASGDPFGKATTLPPAAPVGFTVTPAGLAPGATSIAFSPDGRTLYASSAGGVVLSYPVVGGVALGPPSVFLSGLTQPLGVLATDDALFVSDIQGSDGIVKRAAINEDGTAGAVATVISGLPNGRHNTNGLAIGPDGMLYIANGNSTDSGFNGEGGGNEVRPFSGSLLRVDPTATNLTPSSDMVAATGFRNIYDVDFAPAGHPLAGKAAVPMNGPDGQTYNGVTRPAGEDTLNVVDVGGSVEHFGFPWCLYDRTNGGLDGFSQDPATPCDPLPAAASTGLSSVVRAKPSALFGLHVSADGLAFNPGTSFPAAYDHDLFVAEFGNFFGNDVTGHKVVRVHFDANGTVASVDDFLTGVLPLDLTFAPDGALWVADIGGPVYRVAAVPVPAG